MRRPLVPRHIAAIGPDRIVESRVAGPRLQHAFIKIIAVHLGAHEVPVNLLRDRPVLDVERIQALSQLQEVVAASGKLLCRVIGCAIKQRW